MSSSDTIEQRERGVTVTSPDGSLEFELSVDRNGGAVYGLRRCGKDLIAESPLGICLDDESDLGENVEITAHESIHIDESYTCVAGKANPISDYSNAITVNLRDGGDSTDRNFSVQVRAYDEGVAFRYVLDQSVALGDLRITGERTQFHLARDCIAWAQYLNDWKNESEFLTGYEKHYLKVPITDIGPGQLIGLPILLEMPGHGWLAITEAALRDYSAMYLENPNVQWHNTTLGSRLAPSLDEPSLSVIRQCPFTSPWRVIFAADDPARFIESNMIFNLNDPCEVPDTSWIKPGKAVWPWWNGRRVPTGKHGQTTANLKYYADFAAREGFEYLLVDGGWSERDITKMNGKVDIPHLTSYAAEKGVSTWIWIRSEAAIEQMDEAFPLYREWGVVGVKIDFLERDDQYMVNKMYEMAKTAAENRLMVDFHGCPKPTGMERTYPNVLGYEGVLGLENSRTLRINPDHDLVLPFTRMLAGPMDYTPGAFHNITRDQFTGEGLMADELNKPVLGTRAHQIAMYIVYECPFQMIPDHPMAYEGEPAFEFIRDVPTSWNETRVLEGAVGEYIVIARRRGEVWYLGCLTNWTPRNMCTVLDFLGGGEYSANMCADTEDSDRDAKDVQITTRRVRRGSTLRIICAPGGGCFARFEPVA